MLGKGAKGLSNPPCHEPETLLITPPNTYTHACYRCLTCRQLRHSC